MRDGPKFVALVVIAVGRRTPEDPFVELASRAQPSESSTPAQTGAWEVELELGAGVVLR